MQLFTKGETVTYKGHKATVEETYQEGRTADLVCEIIPFMPTHFMNISCTEVQR